MDNAVIGLVILNALEIETQISLLGQMINHFQNARTVEPSWWLNGLDNLVSSLSVQISARFQSARILSRIFDVLLSMKTSQFLLLSPTRSIQHAQLILKNFVVSVMENLEPVASRSDLGLGIIDTGLPLLRRRLRLVGKLQEFAGRLWSETRDWMKLVKLRRIQIW